MVSAGIYQLSDEELKKHPKKAQEYPGVVEKRWTTDILFALLIWLMWGAMSYVGYSGIKKGNVYRLIAPIDYDGKSCGFEGSQYATNKFFYTVLASSGLGVCVPSCPILDASTNSTSPSDYHCLNNLVPSNPTLRQAYISTSCMTNGTYNIEKNCLCNLKRKSISILRRCKFSDTSIRTKYTTQSAPSYFQAFIADIYTARNIIFGFGFGLAIFLSFMWSHLLEVKTIGYILVWTGLWGTVGCMIALVIIAQRTCTSWENESPAIHTTDETNALRLFSWIILAAAGAFFCLMVFLHKQINLSIRMIALTSTCINDMKFIVFVPILNLIAFGIFLVPCIIYMFYVASDGTFESVIVNGVYAGRKYIPAQGVVDRLWYLFFCLLWTMNWVGGMSAIAIALACAKWYFTEERNVASIGSMTVIRAYGTTIRYHWGTAAFGSLVIAIVQFIRWYLLYLQKVYNRVAGTRTLVKFVCCCVQCCLGCLECCLKFISKNAYIQTAIHGSGFMTGCKDSFYLIARNIFRVGAIHVFGGLALFTGKVFIIAATVAASFFYLENAFSKDLNGIVGVLVLIGLIAWFTTSMFMDVYQMSLETIFMCFLADEEANDGQPKYVDGDFKKFMEDEGKIEPGTNGTTASDPAVPVTMHM